MAALKSAATVSRCLLLVVLTVTMVIPLTLSSPPHPDLSPSLLQGPRHRRDVTDLPIQTFLNDLKTSSVDLIILMERSRAVDRYYFNLQARKLVSHILRYYTKIGDADVRLVVATFAADFTVHIDGMAESLSKCDIWEDYWDRVILNDNPAIWDRTNIMKAYMESKDIFTYAGKTTNKKYIWVLTSGDYKIHQDGDPATVKGQLISAGVTIVSTKVGAPGLEGQIRSIVSSDNHHGGTPDDWVATLAKVGILTDPVNLQLSSTGIFDLCYCDHTFGFQYCDVCSSCPCSTPREDCVCVGGTDPTLCTTGPQRTCPFTEGKYGRYCDKKVEECVDYACANNGKCVEHVNYYTCICPPPLLPEYYCLNVTSVNPLSPAPATSTRPPVIIIGAAAGGGGLLLLLACCITLIVCKKKKRPRSVPTATAETYTNPDVLAQTTALGYNVIHEETMDVPQMPPLHKRPTAVIRPVGQKPPPPPDKSLKPKWGRKNVPSMLKHVPISLWRASVRTEVTLPNAKVDADGQDEDIEQYENSGHLNMAGWEDYLIKLTTTGGLKHFALVRYDRGAYASTSTAWFLPSKDELSLIYTLFNNKQTGSIIGLKAANYQVSKNDGKMLEAFLVGRTPDVLCIGRSKQFLVMGIKHDEHNTGDCYKEVKWVRDSLSRQNK